MILQRRNFLNLGELQRQMEQSGLNDRLDNV